MRPDGKPFIVKEKLLTVDHEDFSFTYEITENNIELVGYAAKVKVVGSEGGDSRIEWSRDGLAEYLQRNIRGMAEAVKRAVKVGEP